MKAKRFWIQSNGKYDTHWTSNTDRVSFKSDDLWQFTQDYAKSIIESINEEDIKKHAWKRAHDQTDDQGIEIEIQADINEGSKWFKSELLKKIE